MANDTQKPTANEDTVDDQSSNQSSTVTTTGEARRKILKGTLAGAGVTALMPEGWINPVINTVIIPAHSQTSVGPNPGGATSAATSGLNMGTLPPQSTLPPVTLSVTTAPATTSPATIPPATSQAITM